MHDFALFMFFKTVSILMHLLWKDKIFRIEKGKAYIFIQISDFKILL